MALVAYSDESDWSDSEEQEEAIPLNELKNETNLNANDVNNKVNESEASRAFQSERETQPDEFSLVKDKIIHVEDNTGSSRIDLPDDSISNFELDNHDLVDDVPTVSTWSVTKDIQNKNAADIPCSTSQKQPKTEPVKKRNKIKFILPALSEFDDEEDEDEDGKLQSAKKKIKASCAGSGLFSMLPEPRGVTSLVPQTVSRKTAPKIPVKKRVTPKPKKPVSVNTLEQDEEEELESSHSNDFFSLSETETVSLPSPTLMLPPIIKIISPDLFVPPKVVSKSPRAEETAFHADLVPLVDDVSSPAPSYIPLHTSLLSSAKPGQQTFDEEALVRLTGRRNKGEIVNLIDINADDALMPKEEWTNRALCDEKPTKSFSKKREGMPTQQQKRKHQITFLAHQAQEREQELRNVWGQNRMTKMQTQSKYGF